MKNLKLVLLKISFIVVFALMSNSIYSQGAAVNTTGANADPSAMLDVNSSDKGMLIPRISLSSTTVSTPVTTPATGLMVFNTATVGDVTPGFYYWDGSQWQPIGAGGTSDADLRRIKTYIYTNAGGH